MGSLEMNALVVSSGTDVNLSRLRQTCESALRTVGYDLVELEYTREVQGWVLRVFIDHPVSEIDEVESVPAEIGTGRITHDDCARASEHLGTVLDINDPIGGAYNLEVSSPGVYRPLRKESDFRRFAGYTAKVKLSEPMEGRRNYSGTLRGAEQGSFTIEVDGQTFTLPISKVQKARLTQAY